MKSTAPAPRMGRRLAVIAAMVLVLDVTGAVAAPRNFSMYDAPRTLPAVPFRDGAGKLRKLSDFRGKVIVLNVWATWCGPCRKEMPTLDRLQARLGGPDFQVVALSADTAGPAAVRRFFRYVGIQHLPLYIDQSSNVLSLLDVMALPTTLLIDRNGAAIGRLTGPNEWDAPEMIEFLRGVIGRTGENRAVKVSD